MDFSPEVAKNRKTLALKKLISGGNEKNMTSQEKLEVSYAGYKVRNSCPVKEKEQLESSPRCIFKETD